MKLINNFTLLYVEDDVETQESMKRILEGDVKTFYQAFDGNEGLKAYKEFKPDIVLTDINMPILDGLLMSQEIKNLDKEVPIIMMSAFDDKKILLNALNIGVDYFTPKPVNMDMIYDKLEQITQNLQNKIDIERVRENELENLENLAHYDTLTKIPNKFLFDLKLDQALTQASINRDEIILFFIDLDNFKFINDTYGHAGGDAVLRKVSENIKNIISMEEIFARIGGDEFSLIAKGNKNIDTLAEKIVEASSLPIEFEDKIINITCSVGVSKYPADSMKKKELIHFADIAMYRAKKRGKATYEFYN